MTILYITRHGETLWNTQKRMQGWHDSPLTEKGMKQAQLLSDRMSKVPTDIIYTSPSHRAFKTAEIIRGMRNIKIIPDEGLKEMNIGEWEGYDQEEIKKINPKELYNFWKSPENFVSQGGESFQSVRKRVNQAVSDILVKNEGKTILIVTHTIALKSIMSEFENREIKDLWEPPVIYQTSLSRIDIANNEANIIMYGDSSHIETEKSDKQQKAV